MQDDLYKTIENQSHIRVKTILVFVTTADGKITKWGNPLVKSWSSKEDKEYFSVLMNESALVIMGSNTYNADIIPPRNGRLLVVMTHKPELYRDQEISGQRIFLRNSPGELVDFYREKGYNKMVILGGPKVATSFLKDNLIDEIWLTIEPRVFGSGGNFAMDAKLDIPLQLISSVKINNKGTLLNKYQVV